ELPAVVECLDRALHVAVIDRVTGHEPADLDDADGGISAASHHGDGVGHGRLGVQRRARRAPDLCGAQARGGGGEAQQEWEGEPADHAFEPESARKPRRSLSGATSTSISSPFAKSSTRIFSDSGSSTYF